MAQWQQHKRAAVQHHEKAREPQLGAMRAASAAAGCHGCRSLELRNHGHSESRGREPQDPGVLREPQDVDWNWRWKLRVLRQGANRPTRTWRTVDDKWGTFHPARDKKERVEPTWGALAQNSFITGRREKEDEDPGGDAQNLMRSTPALKMGTGKEEDGELPNTRHR
ncbi:hypothetical protein NDU88_009644 [Pleurodeles waltl]|uniref:Uncharacterized protein n=1 Tax=Pleurodeles waltl TaxID=8319 RepID=A0AAV7QVW1_PLEWA|nr:hypothetical protein NDU88_009644 [Pleurodeles waltl]